MYQKLVSVIIPTYNRARLVVEAIESVKAQRYPAIQIIVADDGSQDDTAQRVAKFENVEYYYQENKGQAAARNLGLRYAKGEYIASLDSDDRWHKDFLEVAVAGLEQFQADFVFLNWTEISETKQFASDWERSERWRKYSNNNGNWTLLNAKEVRELYVKTCPAPSSALLIRHSSFVSDWNEEMKIADDWFLILEMVLMKPCRAAFTLSPYWTKHVHDNNIYHGREEELEVMADLKLHDEALISRRFQEQLTFAEKVILQKRLAANYCNFGRLNWQRDGFSLKVFRSIASGFTLAPVKSAFYFTQESFYYLRNRFRIARNKYKQSQEN